MSKNVMCSQKELENIFHKLTKLVKNKKLHDGKIHFKYTLPELTNKAVLKFSSIAWLKILSLVSSFETEIEWHGFIEKINDNTWQVNDILLFPHEISSVTVTSQQDNYEEWINSFDDETFNLIRFHGHSHVNMSPAPSDFDMKYRDKILLNILAEHPAPYYVFMIINKRNEISVQIYDIEKNIVYTDLGDIDIVVNCENETIQDFINKAKELTTIAPSAQTKVQNINNKKITTNDEKPIMRDFYEDGNYYCSHCRDFDCKNCKYY